jgi:hypothetical protein
MLLLAPVNNPEMKNAPMGSIGVLWLINFANQLSILSQDVR